MDEREIQKTVLAPGGGKPAEERGSGEAGSREAAKGPSGTLPMPKPGMRPDEATHKLDAAPGTVAMMGSDASARPASEAGTAVGAAEDSDSAPATVPTAASKTEDKRDAAPGAEAGARPVSEATSEAAGLSSMPPEYEVPGLRGTTSRDAFAAPDAPGRAARRRILTPHHVVCVALALALLAVILVGTYTAELWGGKTVPNVDGLTAAEAQRRLEGAGFSVERTDEPADEGVGTVLATEPDHGARVDAGSMVKMSVGAPRIVPDVVGKSADDAKKALADAGVSNIRIEYKNSDEAEGAVLSVSPSRGTVVSKDDEVTLRVAQAYSVPDVVGLSQDEATKKIAEAGLESKIEWRESEGDALSVLSTSPASGERVGSGATVTVTVVAPGARNETYLADYLDDNPRDVSSYLSWKGWTFRYGKTVKGQGDLSGTDCAETGWTKSGVGTLIVTPTPESSKHGSFLGELLTSDVLADGASVGGIRFEPEESGNNANPTVDSATVNTWASRCGLSGIQATLSADQIARETGTSSGNVPDMLVGYGEMDDAVWSVSVEKGKGVTVVVAPKSLYSGVDLLGYDNSLGLYLAWHAAFGK